MEVPDKVGRALARPEKCHIRKGVEIYLRQYYERIKRHRGSGKAIIATARKFLGVIYQTLKNDWIF